MSGTLLPLRTLTPLGERGSEQLPHREGPRKTRLAFQIQTFNPVSRYNLSS